jgi:hypothetical protein
MGPLNCTSNGNKYIMVVVDLATRFIEVGALPTLSTELTIKLLKNQVIFRCGIPKLLITERGTNFTSKMFKDFMKELRVKHHLLKYIVLSCHHNLYVALLMSPMMTDGILPVILFPEALLSRVSHLNEQLT